MGIGGLFIIKIYDIDFLKDTPLSFLPIHLCDAVSWQISNLHFKNILSCLKILTNAQSERYCPGATDLLTIDADASTLSHIAQVEHPIVGFPVGQIKLERIEARTHIRGSGSDWQCGPVSESIYIKCIRQGWCTLYKRELPAFIHIKADRSFLIIWPRLHRI